jgi:long-chain acyl-CoA synthetase
MANFYQHFLKSVGKWPEGIAVEVQHQDPSQPVDRYSFTAMRHLSEGFAQWLVQTERHKAGAHCALLAGNGPAWVAAFLGTLAAGNVVVPLDTALNAKQVRKLLQASDSVLLLVDAKHRAIGEQATAGLPIQLAILDEVISLEVSAPLEFPPREVEAHEVAAILYSSGTTGDPKGVMLTHDNLAAETDSIFEVFVIGEKDSFLGILPLFHAFALVVNLLLPMAGGSRVVFLESLNTADLIRALPSVNIFACVPQFFYLIHERIWKQVNERGKAAAAIFRLLLGLSRFGRRLRLNLGKVFFRKIHTLIGPNMRYLATGGSRFDPAVGREFEDFGFTLLQGYGLTETTGAAIYTPPGAVDIATVGRPLPGLEVKILNAQVLEGQDGPAVGEVLMRGRIVMKGYYHRPDATAEILKDGWLYTGDLGYIDSKGNLVLTGRAKEIIVLSSGKNIYPEEIEAHYLKSPLIKELCVLGLESAPGEPRAERLHGVIVPNFDELKAQKIVNSREALRYSIENLSVPLPSTKRLLSYELRQEELPRTTTRKIKRFEVERQVRERLAAGQNGLGEPANGRSLSPDDCAWLAQSGVERALAVIRNAIKIQKDEIHPADNLELDLGLDSMERVELLVALERELGGAVEDSVISQVYTVRELVDVVRDHTTASAKHAEAPVWEDVLRQEPNDPAILAITRPTPITAFWFLGTRLANVMARDVFRLKVYGLEKLPEHGPFIIAPNHQSYLDPPLLVSPLPWSIFRDLFYVGTSDIFGDGLWRLVARSLKLIPVDADANLVPAMQAAAYGLRHGKVLVLFPEGERSIDGVPRVFKKGAAILATHLNVPIFPVALDGLYEAWPRNRNFQKFTPTRIAIGDPILPSSYGENHEQAYDLITQALHARVRAMWDKLHEELYG